MSHVSSHSHGRNLARSHSEAPTKLFPATLTLRWGKTWKIKSSQYNTLFYKQKLTASSLKLNKSSTFKSIFAHKILVLGFRLIEIEGLLLQWNSVFINRSSHFIKRIFCRRH